MQKTDTHKLPAIDDKPDNSTEINGLEARMDECTRELTDETSYLRILMEQSRDGIVILDQDGQVYESNRKFAEMLGYPHDVMVQLNVRDWEFLHPPEHLVEMIHGVDEKGDHFETRHRRKDGSIYDVEISTNAAWFAGQKLVLCVCRDITERKRIENSLLESEEMQRKLLQTVPDLIVRTDMQGTILFVNDFGTAGFETLRKQDIYGKNILSFVAEHDVPRVLENLRLRLAKNLGPQEYQLHLSDDAVIDVEINGDVMRDQSENPLGMVFVVRDITSRKLVEKALRESEERFKALHNASFGGIAIHDQGVILDCNQGLSEISGFDHDELIGMDGLLLIGERSRAAVMNNIRSGYEKPYEAFGLRKNGEEYPLRLDARNIPYNGKIVRVVEFRDITERKRAEKALEQKNQELEQFVHSVSHDLTSPLVTVKTFAGMLRQDLQGSDQQQINDDLNYIDKAADKMQQLLDALLQYSRIGRIDSPAQMLSANQTVEDCLATLAGILQQHGVQVATSMLPQQLQGDPLHFGQIWQNLIENAVKYRGIQAQPQIEIGATLQGHDVVFYVRDNGIGIAPEHNERIFNLFSQLNPESDGTGLGLALVSKIVSIYHGRIWVESAGKGKGSCFMFTLPGARSS